MYAKELHRKMYQERLLKVLSEKEAFRYLLSEDENPKLFLACSYNVEKKIFPLFFLAFPLG